MKLKFRYSETMKLSPNKGRIAVIIPCYNEEITIEKVVREARRYLPDAEVFVFDNNSTDATADRARKAGAIVIPSPRQGKGFVIRHAFDVIDADYYLLVDGDDTYPLEEADKLLRAVTEQNFAMAVGSRFERRLAGSFRRFHVFGNRFFSALVSLLVRRKITDMLSGYRLLNRELVNQIRLQSKGFEVETDLTLQAIAKGHTITEIPVQYQARPKGSHSKLKTYRDGVLILKSILKKVG